LFVVMLLGTKYEMVSMDSLPSWFIGLIFMLLLLLFIIFFLFSQNYIKFLFSDFVFLNDNYLLLNDFNNLTILSYNILSSYYIIIAALILLVAMLGSIFLNDIV
jgi:NADH:ubiquinone oxidoreductase subunit 6 (subunit J)